MVRQYEARSDALPSRQVSELAVAAAFHPGLSRYLETAALAACAAAEHPEDETAQHVFERAQDLVREYLNNPHE